MLSSNSTWHFRKVSWLLQIYPYPFVVFGLPFRKKLWSGSSHLLITPRIIHKSINTLSSSMESSKLLFPCLFTSATAYFRIFNSEFLPSSSSKNELRTLSRSCDRYESSRYVKQEQTSFFTIHFLPVANKFQIYGISNNF